MRLSENQFREAILLGEREAASLHERLKSDGVPVYKNGRVQIESILDTIGIALFYQKLNGVLGYFLKKPIPGIAVTTERPSSVQRYTIAHELGHYLLGHAENVDDDKSINQGRVRTVESNAFEISADTFASSFLFPRGLLVENLKELDITNKEDFTPSVVYRLSLWLGASYQATCYALGNQKILPLKLVNEFSLKEPKKLKQQLLEPLSLEKYHPDVWRIDPTCSRPITGKPNDVLVLDLAENSGYLWNIEEFKKKGVKIIGIFKEEDDDHKIGSSINLKVAVQIVEEQEISILLKEVRPWDVENYKNDVIIQGSFFKEHAGLPRRARLKLLAS